MRNSAPGGIILHFTENKNFKMIVFVFFYCFSVNSIFAGSVWKLGRSIHLPLAGIFDVIVFRQPQKLMKSKGF